MVPSPHAILCTAELAKSVKELEALSAYPEPEGFHAKRVAALQAELRATSGGTSEQRVQLQQVGGGGKGRVAQEEWKGYSRQSYVQPALGRLPTGHRAQ